MNLCLSSSRPPPPEFTLSFGNMEKPSTHWFHDSMRGWGVGTKHLTCLSLLCSADGVLGAADILTSWWVLSVLLHSSSFRFSSSLSFCFCSRWSAPDDGIPPRTLFTDGIWPRPSVNTPGKPVLPELSGSRPEVPPLLYSAQRFRMVSSRWRSCG